MVDISEGMDRAWEIIKDLTDPELPFLTLEDLGIINQIENYKPGEILVTISPTYIGCPAISVIEEKIKQKLEFYGFKTQIARSFSPPWTTDWISKEGKEKMREFGITPPISSENIMSRDEDNKKVECPQCRSIKTEKISEFGSTACKSLYRCMSCQEPFDYFKCI
jgi:ring-1,2-phenylacetyl-CoA epoxidase subunit PaaD